MEIELLLLFLLGSALGSFLNALIWRMKEGISIVTGRSQCPACSHALTWFELIPILSFLLQRGKCRSCVQTIYWQYPIVELVVGGLFVLVYYLRGGIVDAVLVRDLLAILWLTTIFVYDLKYQLILDRVSFSGIALFLAFNIVLAPANWVLYVIGGIIGGGFFAAQFIVSKGRWIGGGDIRLGALMGVLLGWKMLLVALFLAYMVGAALSIILVLMKKATLASKTPFGTYLAFATVVVMYYGEAILTWYLGLII